MQKPTIDTAAFSPKLARDLALIISLFTSDINFGHFTCRFFILFYDSNESSFLSQHLVFDWYILNVLLGLEWISVQFFVFINFVYLGLCCKLEENFSRGNHFKVILNETMLDRLLSNRIFIWKEGNVEFFIKLFSAHYSKTSKKLISETFAAFSTWWTH